MYRLRQKLSRQAIFRFIIGFLVINFASPMLYAQPARRGIFMQDAGEDFDAGGGDGLGSTSVDDMRGMQRRGRVPGITYQVHVLGEVVKPGTYRVSPSMRVLDAIELAEGFNSQGSERFVELRKRGQTRGRALDLFAYKVLGQLSQNPYLQDNDTIFVPLKTKVVEIRGPIRRPGVYELRSEKSLNDVLNLAGGFTVGANRDETIKVIRFLGGKEKEILEIPTDPAELDSFDLRDGDFIVVQHKFLSKHQFDYNIKQLPNDNIYFPAYEDKVFVIGGVKAPGAFKFNQYYTVRQYLTLAGGTTIMAKRGKINVVTVDGKSFKAKDGSYEGVVNPGDTIVVPEKAVPTTFYIGLLPTIASLGLSAVALFR